MNDAAAMTLHLTPYLDRKPAALSGGQRQRVAMGRALMREPKLFLFDEPLSNLDAQLRVAMRAEIRALHGRIGNTVVYVTHDQVEAMTMADRIVVLRAGHVEQVGSPLELYHHPDNLFVAGFIGSPRMNFLDVTVREGSATHAVVELPGGGAATLSVDAARAATDSKATLGVRPEDLARHEGDFTLPMHVDVAERLGGSTFLYGRCGGMDNFVAQREGLDRTRHGQDVDILVAAETCYLFDPDGLAYHRLTESGRQVA